MLPDEELHSLTARFSRFAGETRGFEGGFVAPFTAMEREAPSPPPDEERFLLGLTSWCAGRRSDELLARSHPHGAWLEWLGPSSHAG